MKSRALIVVDMQNDFVTGSLRNERAIEIVPDVVEEVERAAACGYDLYFTKDTHDADYSETLESKTYPEHCRYGTEGFEIIDELKLYSGLGTVLYKNGFGLKQYGIFDRYDIVEIIGVCSDICVVSVALGLRITFPDKMIMVKEKLCAGTSRETHEAAMTVMKSCLIDIC